MSLFNELKRRNVIRVAIAYLIIGWLLAQVSTTLEDALNLPPWFDTLIVTVMLIGFPIAILIAWVYELTPEGIKKEKDITRDDSITNVTAKKLNYITIFAALAVVGIFVWQQMNPNDMDSRVRENDNVAVEQVPVIPAQAEIQSLDLQINNKSIAVLPFENRSPDPNDAYFTDGIHDDLLTSISKIGAIKTISRTSVMQYKHTTKTIGQIGRELNVATVLEGGVQRAGNRVRINVQLIDVKTDDHLWAQIYDRELNMDNIFEIQTEIAEKIASALKAQLTPQEQDILSTRPTQNLEAYESYLLGKQRMETRQPKALEEAIVLYQKAIDLDSKFALAYVGLADTYMLQPEYSGANRKQSLDKASKALDQALKSNNKLGEAYTTLGSLKRHQNDFEGALEALDKALKLNPNYPTLYHRYGLVLNQTGKPKQALAMFEKGLQLDPLSAVISSNVSANYGALGQPEKAIKQAIKTIKLEPNNPIYYAKLAQRYFEYSNELDKAIMWNKKALKINSEQSNNYLYLIITYLEMGDEESAIKTLEQLHEKAPNTAIEYYMQGAIAYYQNDKQKIRKYVNLILQTNPLARYQTKRLIVLDVQAGKHKKVLSNLKGDYPQLFAQPPVLTDDNKPMSTRLAWVYQQSAQPEKSTQLLDVLINSYSKEEKAELKNRAPLMKIYSLQGNTKEFFKLFEQNIKNPYRVDSENTWFVQYRDPIYENMMQQPEFLKLKAQADQLMADARARLEKHNQAEESK